MNDSDEIIEIEQTDETLPEGWQWKKIGEVAKIFVGKDLKEGNYSPTKDDTYKYPVYSNAVENEGLYGYYNAGEYTGESLTIVGRGDLGKAFTRKGSYGAIGRLLVLFPNDGVIAHYITEYVNNKINILQERSGIPQLTGEQIANYKIVLPPFPEQQKIVDILCKWNEGTEKLQRLINYKMELKRGLMAQLLTQQKRFKEFEGTEWETIKLGDI